MGFSLGDLNFFSGDSAINKQGQKTPLLGTMLPGGFLTESYFNKEKQNNDLDKGIQTATDPGYLDPNDIGTPQPGGSAYAQMQRALNQQQANNASQQADMGAAGDAANARSGLAMRGGLSDGASERLGMNAMDNSAQARQGVENNLNNANLQTGIADEGMRRTAYNAIRMKNYDLANQKYAGALAGNATIEANRPKGMLGLGFLGL